MLKLATSPATAVMIDGEAAMVKSDEAALTVRVRGRLKVSRAVAPTPVTVRGYTPEAVVESVVMVRVEEAAPVTVEGLKL